VVETRFLLVYHSNLGTI